MRIFLPTYNRRHLPAKTSAVWWAEFTVNDRRFRKSTGLRDENAATARAGQLLRDEELRAAGIETHADTTRATLACLLDEYRAELARRRCAPKHVETTIARCRALVQGVASMAALTPVAVRLGLERLRGASAKTVNGYRTALSGFCSWLVREGRWAANPVEVVERAREYGGRKRRALTPDEQRALLACGSEYKGTYMIALNTGLRRAEIEALCHEDFNKDEDGRLTVRVRSGSAKNRKEDVLPLPTGFVRPTIFITPTMTAFRRDLKAAGIVDPDLDFHSLRRSFATNLARAGVPLVVAQRLMRHSDPALTSNIYTTINISDEQDAVDRANPDQRVPDGSHERTVGACVRCDDRLPVQPGHGPTCPDGETHQVRVG